MALKIRSFVHLITFVFIAYVSQGFATSIQKTGGISFSNPAALTLVNKQQIVLGASEYSYNVEFQGSSAGLSGTATPNADNFLPNFRYAARLNDKTVAGIDITQPYATDIVYPNNSIVRYAFTVLSLTATDISPNIAYSITNRLAAGIGFDAQYLKVELADIRRVSGMDAEFNNQGDGWGFGWHAGLLYSATQSTKLGLSFFSAESTDLSGPSTLLNHPTTTVTTNYKTPDMAVFTITQFLSHKWWLDGLIGYTWWHTPVIALSNTVLGTVLIPENPRNTWRFVIRNTYALNDKWRFNAGLGYDEGPSNEFDSTPASFAVGAYYPFIGARYQLTKSLSLNATYAHLFIHNAPINNTRIDTFGTVFSSGDVFETSLTWDM